jgi:serine protease Do
MKTKIMSAASLAAALFFIGMGVEVRWPAKAKADVPWITAAATTTVPSPPSTTAAVPPAGINEIKLMNQTFSDLATRVSSSVVSIYSKSGMQPKLRKGMPGTPQDDFEMYFGFPFGGGGQYPLPPRESLGSGFVINAQEGYIVTNSHVVRMAGKNADEIMVKFAGEDENQKGHQAKVIGADEVSDVALLQLVEKRSDLKAIPLGDSDNSKVGEWVLAVGNPYGHSHTVTQGIVSAQGRNLDGARNEFLQTSASINPGNSGGPLINMDGEVIGINTAIDPRAQGIGFAIPINVAKRSIDQLASKGKVARAWMGIAIEDVNEDIAGYMKLKNPEGVLVREVIPNQPAASAGMEPFDVITKINGETIKNTRDLYRQVEKLEVGQSASIEVLRSNQAKNLKVKLTEQPS